MPDHQSSTDETSRLFGNQNPPPTEWRIPLELMKAFGLSTILAGLVLGFFVSANYVFTSFNFGPIHMVCDTCSTDMDKTYILQLFHFMHSCVMIDFNPGKPFVAVIFIVGLVTLMLFTVLDQERLKRDYAAHPCLKYVVIFSQYTWKFRIFCFLLFPLCFVNSPTYDPDPFVDPQDATWKQLFSDGPWLQFVRHYIPYMLWQLAVALMAIEQAWYHHAMKSMPFGFPATVINIYLWVMLFLYFYYTLWIVTFLVGVSIPGHTYLDDDGVVHNWYLANFIEIAYGTLSVIVPIILSVARSYGVKCEKSKVWVITFSPLKKEQEN